MKKSFYYQNNYPAIIFGFFILLAYGVGVFSTFHNLPSILDFFVNLQVAVVVFFGLSVILMTKQIKKIGLDSWFWLAFFLLLAIQPLLHTVAYPDAIIFPLAMLLACFLISIIANNIEDKELLIVILAFGIWLIGLATVAIQGLQYLGYESLFVLFITPDNPRFYANLGQPNQTAFVIALAMLSNYFLVLRYYASHRNLLLLLIICIPLLSMGIALTGSRASLIFVAFMAFLPFFTAQSAVNGSIKQKISWYLGFFGLASIGYGIGVYLLDHYEAGTITAINRGTGDLHYRYYLAYQAWLSFQSNPLTGIGWNNFVTDSLNHIDQLVWFPFAMHSHNFIAQIAAEYGIIGLSLCIIPVIIIFKKLLKKNDLDQTYVLFNIGIFLLYSLSEFPLWIFKYLIIFSLLLALINTKKFTSKLNFQVFYAVISTLIFIATLFYYQSYLIYNQISAELQSSERTFYEIRTDPKKVQDYRNYLVKTVEDTPSVFGFSDYREMFIYQLLPLDSEKLQEKITLGNRVLSNHMADELLSKQATYYGLNQQPTQSLLMFKSACFLYDYKSCYEVNSYLYKVKMQNKNFEPIYHDFNQWVQHNSLAKASIEKSLPK